MIIPIQAAIIIFNSKSKYPKINTRGFPIIRYFLKPGSIAGIFSINELNDFKIVRGVCNRLTQCNRFKAIKKN